MVVHQALLWEVGMRGKLVDVTEVERAFSEAGFERHSDRADRLVSLTLGNDLSHQVACLAAFKPTRTRTVFLAIDRRRHFQPMKIGSRVKVRRRFLFCDERLANAVPFFPKFCTALRRRHPTSDALLGVVLPCRENLAHTFARHLVLLPDLVVAHARARLESANFRVTIPVPTTRTGTGLAKVCG